MHVLIICLSFAVALLDFGMCYRTYRINGGMFVKEVTDELSEADCEKKKYGLTAFTYLLLGFVFALCGISSVVDNIFINILETILAFGAVVYMIVLMKKK